MADKKKRRRIAADANPESDSMQFKSKLKPDSVILQSLRSLTDDPGPSTFSSKPLTLADLALSDSCLEVSDLTLSSVQSAIICIVEARVVVLAALRMIKEKYSSGDSVEDDLMIIFDDEECQNQHNGRVREAIFKLLRYDLGLEVLSARMRVKKDTGGKGSENTFALNEVVQSSDLASPLDSPARRPAVLQRLKITKVSLDHWLHKR